MYVMCDRVQIIWHYSNWWNKFYPFQYFLAKTKQRVYSKGNLIFRVFWLLVSFLCVQQMLWLYLISRPATAVQRIKLRESTSVCSKCVNYNFASNHPFAAQCDDGDVKSTKTKALKWKSESIKKNTHHIEIHGENSWTWENWRWNLIMCKFPIASPRVCFPIRRACFYIFAVRILHTRTRTNPTTLWLLLFMSLFLLLLLRLLWLNEYMIR